MSIDVITLVASKKYTDKQIEKASIKGVDLSGYVQTVNGVKPDANGNVQIAVSGGSGVAVSSVEPAEDDIPKVFLTGSDFGNMTNAKNEVNMEMEYISKTDKFNAAIKIKFQGNTSLTFPKKNFTIKMYTDDTYESKLRKRFKDWNHDSNKYVLKANYIDHSHARNVISARLWSEVVASRPDYGSLPDELRSSPRNGAIDGFPIKLYVNGTYQGIYTWNVGKDDWMWGMDEDNPNHALLCAETNTDGTYRETPCNFRALWSGVDETDWSVEVGTNSTELKNSLNNLIQFVMDNDGDAFRNGIGTYLDIQSAIDYYIFQYEICGLDGLGKNMLLATYDGTKWICGAYDMDSTFGLWFNGATFVSTSYACPEHYQEQFSLLWERIEANFWQELKERQAELRKTVLSYSNMVTHFERFMDIIGKELYAEDLTIYTSIPCGTTNNIKQIRNFIRDRQVYVDAEFAAMPNEGSDPEEPDVPIIPETGEYTLELNNVGLWKENGLDGNITTWKSSDIMPLPTGFNYDTITDDNTLGKNTIITVFDADQNFVAEYAGQPATCLVRNVHYYAIAANYTETTLGVKFTETYPGAVKCPTPYAGLWKSAGLDSSVTTWITSDKYEIPNGIASGKIRFAADETMQKIITTFDDDGNFIKENANVSEIAFDSTVKYFAVAVMSRDFKSASYKATYAMYVYIE